MPNDTSKIKINYKTELEVHSDTFIQQSKSHGKLIWGSINKKLMHY